jgi:hypothetical protein
MSPLLPVEVLRICSAIALISAGMSVTESGVSFFSMLSLSSVLGLTDWFAVGYSV